MSAKKSKLWMQAADALAKLGVYRIDPTLRDICILWASTRKPTPAVLAKRYLYELIELLHECHPKDFVGASKVDQLSQLAELFTNAAEKTRRPTSAIPAALVKGGKP